MKTVTTVCGTCGAKIPADAHQGVCPACLLETGLGLLTDEVGSSRCDDSRKLSGQRGVSTSDHTARLAKVLGDLGDYELLEEIGRGGQGVVYRAHQKSLNRTVALKVIGLGPWTTEAHLKRFRREAEAAAHLEHPCIVPIYEVSERDAQCYFSMKFVEGGQLDHVVGREPMPIRRAVELIAKVARTVHYAHEHGILHRDIKPGNILLDHNGEPHLTDFGLARLVEAESTITGTLEVLGTPSYMAPEQAVGNPAGAGPTSATDVYGLGAVLYQLLTGQPPFAGGTTYETVKLLLETEPRQPRLLNPKVDRDLSAICLKCLEKDPNRRYSSALASAEDLEHWLKREPIHAKRSGIFTHTRKWVRRNPSTTVLVTLLLALAVGLSVTIWNRKPPVVIPKSVAVLPFENLSPDPDNAYLADGIQEEILTRLAGIADLKVISRTSTQGYQSKPRNLSQIAKQLGAANILEGTVQKTGDQIRVNVQLINAQTDSHLWAETYDRKLTDILGVESEIAKGIAESLEAKLTGGEKQALAVKPTNNPEAYDAYLRGVAIDGRNALSSDEWKAVDSYERAVQLDPNFALAWARLSSAHATLYFQSVDTTATRRDAAKRALENAQKLQPNSPETQVALGYYQYRVLRDYEAAKTIFGRIGKMLPANSEVPRALGLIARREGHWDESVAYFERALTVDPRNVELLTDSATTYTDLRQFPAALKLYDRALDINPNDLDLVAAKAGIYQAEGNLQEAAKLLSEVSAQTASAFAFLAKVGQLILERNHGEAIRLLQARQTQFQFPSEIEKIDNQVDLAWAQRLAGDTAGAKASAEQVRNTLESLCKNQPDSWGLVATLAFDNAVLEEKISALNEIQRAVILLPSAKDRLMGPSFEEEQAMIQLTFGENSRAVSTLTQLLQTPYAGGWSYHITPVTPALLRLDPVWDPLRGDPVFQKLCEEKLDKSIAVLPFENLSRDPDNAYFAEGIQEEILTRLAGIADLKVISRTSTSRYKSKPDNLPDIAKQLGVANILEGSVQKAGDQVRVNVQLINAETDSHLWAETFDRKVIDIFGVESEIAKGIAESLQAKMTGREKQALAVKPTNNPEAYDVYLRGLAFEARIMRDNETSLLKAVGFFERAVQLDPNFAIAWARLSRVNATFFYLNDVDTTRRDEAKRALENAQKLAPTSAETLLALGYYQYKVLGDRRASKDTFDRVSKMLPESSEGLFALARLAKADGHWDQSIAYYDQALTSDPRNVELLAAAALTYGNLRQFPAALRLYDRALDIMPDDPDLMTGKATIYLAHGKLREAARLLARIDEQVPSYSAFEVKHAQLRLDRNYGELIRFLQARQVQSDSEYDKTTTQVDLALAQRLAGDTAGAKATAEPARNAFERLYRDQPDNAFLAFNLSLAYAAMGEKNLALQTAERAVVLARSKDPPHGPALEENLAFVQTMCGENSRAIATLTRLLQTPYEGGAPCITPAFLRLDPFWDPLRGDPAFQKLCEEK